MNMTENSTSAVVGSAAVDAYLDSVERALIAAGAPRPDRMQVLQDLESQIADMLAQQPQPLTEEAVRSVIAKLEPASHFAQTYGNGKEDTAPELRQVDMVTQNRFAMIAAAACATIVFGCLLLALGAATGMHGPAVGLLGMLLFAGVVATPIALWLSIHQMRTQPGQFASRNLVLRSTAVYCAIVPALLFLVACIATEGGVLYPIGIAAFIYVQYVLTHRLLQRVSNLLPRQSATDIGTRDTATRSATGSKNFSNALSMAPTFS
jgi:HAAS domain-containing protein